MPEFHASMAAAHRRTQQRHLVAARIHRSYAQRLEVWAKLGALHDSRPVFMGAVAATAGTPSAALTLVGPDNTEAFVAASDATSRAAHELELVFAEGPSQDAMHQPAPVVVTNEEVPLRWPHYGPGLRQLGVQAVAAVGLHVASACMGSLTVYDPHTRTGSHPGAHQLGQIANALVDSVLLAPDAVTTHDDHPALSLFEQQDFQPELHQAAGKIHAASHCGIPAALALIRAHALAEGKPAATVALDILNNTLTLP